MACCLPDVTAAASVIRAGPGRQRVLRPGRVGAFVAHQIATGESGSRMVDSTTESGVLDHLATQAESGLSSTRSSRARVPVLGVVVGRRRGRRRG
jgi:hypothetical protein